MKTLILLIVLTSVQSFASEDYTSYEDIVRNLQAAESRGTYSAPDSGLDAVRIHAGIGMISSRISLDVPKGLPQSKSMDGAEAVIGIDLFSPRWLAETAVRAFNSTPYVNSEIRLREFDLRIIHEVPMSSQALFRMGGGLTARYLNFSNELSAEGKNLKSKYTTPAYLMLAGFHFQFHPKIAIGVEMSYRSAIISDTIDESAVDGGLRLTGTF